MRRVRRRSLVVLCYHRVLPPDALPEPYPLAELVVTPEALAQHASLCRTLYDCLPLREAVQRLRSDGTPDKPLLSFTFDDGYWDNVTHAAPVLEAHGVRGTFFVVTGLLGTQTAPWYDQLARAVVRLADRTVPELSKHPTHDDLAGKWIAEHFRHRHGLRLGHIVSDAKRLAPPVREEAIRRLNAAVGSLGAFDTHQDRLMTPDDARRLAAAGHEVASHTRTHPLLPQLTDEEALAELAGSRDDLAALIGGPVSSLAYPNGSYDGRVAGLARRAGYAVAVTMRAGLNRPDADGLELGRVFVSQQRLSHDDGALSTRLMELELCGAADVLFLRRWRSRGAS